MFILFIFYTVVKVYILHKILFTLITSCFLDIFFLHQEGWYITVSLGGFYITTHLEAF